MNYELVIKQPSLCGIKFNTILDSAFNMSKLYTKIEKIKERFFYSSEIIDKFL